MFGLVLSYRSIIVCLSSRIQNINTFSLKVFITDKYEFILYEACLCLLACKMVNKRERSRKQYGSCCSAVGCSMRKGTNLLSKIQMYSIPKNPERRLAWIVAMRRKDWVPSAASRICSLHFITGKPGKERDHPDWAPSIFAYTAELQIDRLTHYEKYQRFKTDSALSSPLIQGCPTRKKYLKRNAIPSLHLPVFRTDTMQKTGKEKEMQYRKEQQGPENVLFEETADDTTENRISSSMSLVENTTCPRIMYLKVPNEYSSKENSGPCLDNALLTQNNEIYETIDSEMTSKCNENVDSPCAKRQKTSVESKNCSCVMCYDKTNSEALSEYSHKKDSDTLCSENSGFIIENDKNFETACKKISSKFSENKSSTVLDLKEYKNKHSKYRVSIEDFRIEDMEDPRLAKEFFRLYHINKAELEHSKKSLEKKTLFLKKTVDDLKNLLKLCKCLNPE